MKPTATRYDFLPRAMFEGDPSNMPEGDHFAVAVEWRGGATWAVMREAVRRVWSESTLEWEFEPSPSNRDNAFLARTRYSLDVALAIGERLATQARAIPHDDSALGGDHGAPGQASGAVLTGVEHERPAWCGW